MVREKYDKNFSVEKIPLDDSKTFDLFSRGHTIGIFQFESSGMQEYLRKLQPNRVEDLIAMNALYRPGPMSMIDNFIARKKGRMKITYAHPSLEPILDETYGIIVYQEQVMRITSELGGFSLAEADIMRRIMGKKKKKEMLGQKEKFINGCISNGIDKKTADEIADMIEKFASYGFNKSHAAAYALIAYQTGFLKSNYPAEFMAANLSSEVNNTDRVVALIEDCRKMGIEVVPPDINHSQAQFIPLGDNKIAFGMTAIKNVGIGAIQSIVDKRNKEGKYKNIFHLLEHVDSRLVNKKVLESLAQSGALDSLEGNRAQNYHAIEKVIEFGQNLQLKTNKNLGQNSLFDIHPDMNDIIVYPELPDIPDWSPQDKLVKEKEFLGFYITGHPLYAYKNIVNLYSTNLDVQNGTQNGDQGNINICGMITEIRTLLDKKQNKMAFVKIEDFGKTYEAVVFGSVFSDLEDNLYKDALVLLNGRLNSQLDDPVIKIICENAMPLDQVPVKMTDSLILRIDKSEMNDQKITYLKNTLNSNRGNVPVYFRLKINGSDEVNMVSKKVKINVNAATIDELEKILTIKNIKIQVKKL
jgi:DNA polymerase-3 subunit alpha